MNCPYHKIELTKSKENLNVDIMICQLCKNEKVIGRDGIYDRGSLIEKKHDEVISKRKHVTFNQNNKVAAGSILNALRLVYKYSFDEALQLVRDLDKSGNMVIMNKGDVDQFQELLNDDGYENLPVVGPGVPLLTINPYIK